MKRVSIAFLLVSFCGLISCSSNKDESTLSSDDLKFIQSLGILNDNEEIELFESNGGLSGIKQSGNFITKERIASYWIEDDEKDIRSAYFKNEIDSIALTDLTSKPTYASYLTVYKVGGEEFKVYVDADSTRLYQFLDQAQNNWKKCRVDQ